MLKVLSLNCYFYVEQRDLLSTVPYHTHLTPQILEIFSKIPHLPRTPKIYILTFPHQFRRAFSPVQHQ
jgi:hypothetical protein